jgi:hypothetical protein
VFGALAPGNSTGAITKSKAMSIPNPEQASPPDYVPLSAWAVATVSVLPFAALALVFPFLVFVSLAGCVMGLAGWNVVRRSQGQIGGRRLLVFGLCTHVGIAICVFGWSAYVQSRIAPAGFQPVSIREINRAQEFVAHQVAVAGWVEASREPNLWEGISRFRLVESRQDGFGTSYKADEQLEIIMEDQPLKTWINRPVVVLGRLESYRGDDERYGELPKFQIIAKDVRPIPFTGLFQTSAQFK